ncbi:Tetratricopeptide repeat-containing protein [Desulfonatronum zhilinae]|nr:Tetratricopeptide repeat-containing protein [Desulfonatronum zhilinae]
MPRLTPFVLGALLVLLSTLATQTAAQTPAGPDRPAPSLPGPGDEIPDWQAWLELARLQSYVEQFDDSLTSYDRVLRDRPDHVQARLERAKVLTWAGRQEEAWKDLQSIPERALDDETRLIMADLHAARQDYDAATRIYEAHLEHRPGDDRVRLKLAEVLSWAGSYPESLKQYELLLEKLPQDVQLRRKYAFVLSWAGRHQDAIRALQGTLE